MRLVRMDELTYGLFSGMGAWRLYQRKELVKGDWSRTAPLHSLGETLADALYGCEFYENPAGEPLTRKELVELLARLMREWPKTLRERFMADVKKDRDWGKYRAAHWLADQLADFTILRDSPEPPFFRFANFEGGSGMVAESDEE